MIRKIEASSSWTNKSKPKCRHPSHNPPAHLFLPAGTYVHECPNCKHTTAFKVAGGFLTRK